MTIEDISFREEYSRLLRRWWLIALLTVLGACLGWMLHLVRPPLYETAATFSVVINLQESGPLTELEQDQAIAAFKAIIISSPVLEQVQAEAATQGIPVEDLTLDKRVFIERRQALLDLIVRNPDPERAAQIANLWADLAYDEMLAAYGHALQAQSLGMYQQSITNCQQTEISTDTLCDSASWNELDTRLAEVTEQRQAELNASRALLPYLVFDLSQYATVPAVPIVFRAAVMILGGALVGFICGLILAWLPFGEKRR